MTTGAEAGCAYESVGARSKALSSAPSEHCAHKVTSVVSDSLRPRGLHPTRLLCPWDSPGKNTAASCHALLQGIFPTQGLNPRLLHLPALAGGFFTTSATWEAAQIKHTHRHANWSSLQVRRRPTPPSPCLGAPTCRDQPAGRPSCSPSNLCRLSLGLTSASPVAV